MKTVAYYILYGIFYLVSLLPFSVLYVISDVLFFFVYHVAGYRKDVVRKNLQASFPQKDSRERKEIERKFYHCLCDYFVETVKLLSISPRLMLKHIEFRNVEEIESCFDEGQTAAGILGHYCNWEYLSASGLVFKRHPEAIMGLIYHPLRNPIFDRLMLDMRQSTGGVCIPKKDILRYLLTYKSEGRMSLFGYISDQAPKWENIHLWIDFLHQETPVFTGAERIMKKMNNAVFYVDMERPRRGHYVCTFQLITREPKTFGEFEITKRFFSLLEESINRQPELYLWSHNHWKRTREEFDRRFKVENGRVIKL